MNNLVYSEKDLNKINNNNHIKDNIINQNINKSKIKSKDTNLNINNDNNYILL
jgi:hypothetical protein